MNKTVIKETHAQQLKQASFRVRSESMQINAEFDEIEHGPEIKCEEIWLTNSNPVSKHRIHPQRK